MSSRERQKLAGTENRQSGRVTSFDGTPVFFDYYPGSSDHLVVVIPGFWRTRDHPSMGQLAELVNGLGDHVAIVDLRGHGDSGGVYGFNLHEHEDVYAVARHLCEMLHPGSISIIGLSVGGAVAVSTVTHHPDLPWSALLLISPVADFAKILPRLNPFRMHRHLSLTAAVRPPRFDWRFLRSEKLKACDEIAEVRIPLALIHVKNDWLVHHRHSLWLYERAHEPKELHILDIPGCYHADRIVIVARETLAALISDFLGRTRKQKAALSRGFD